MSRLFWHAQAHTLARELSNVRKILQNLDEVGVPELELPINMIQAALVNHYSEVRRNHERESNGRVVKEALDEFRI